MSIERNTIVWYGSNIARKRGRVISAGPGTYRIEDERSGRSTTVEAAGVKPVYRPPPKVGKLAVVPSTKAAKLEALTKMPRVRAAAYLDFVRSHPCAYCGHVLRSEAHHWPSRGAGGGDERALPLCSGCHAEFHGSGSLGMMDGEQTRLWFRDQQIALLAEWGGL